jgi:hypothetical protein
MTIPFSLHFTNPSVRRANRLLVKRMQRTIGGILLLILTNIACVGCNSLAPDTSSGDPSLSWSDQREIEGLLASLDIKYPIVSIGRAGPNQWNVECQGRPLSYCEREMFYFTAYRKDGHWHADKSSVRIGKMYEYQM